MIPIATGAPSYMIPVNATSRDHSSYPSPLRWITRFFAAFCGLSIRILLLAILIVDLAIASVMVQRFTSINSLVVGNASPPAAVTFSEVVGAVSVAYVLFSFCCFAVPMLLTVGDTIAFVTWFAATIVLGISLNQTLNYSCQTLAITLTTGVGSGYQGLGSGLGTFGVFGVNNITQQVFDSCNLAKTLFAFHVIATVLFIGTAANAAIQASAGGRRRRGQRDRVIQRGNYETADYRGQKVGAVQPMPEIVV